MRRLIAVLCVLSLSLLAVGVASSAAARKPCGSVKPKAPPFNSGVTSFKVTVIEGTITCAQAKTLFTNFYVAPGNTSAGPGNTSIEVLKNGFTCKGGGFAGTATVPILCTKGKNEVKGVG